MSPLRVFCLSLNHTCTPIDVREQVAFDRDEGIAFLRELCAPDAAEGILLSTCNRTEIYTALPQVDASDPRMRILELLADRRGFRPRHAPPNHWRAEGPAAVTHLLRVASGLESQVLGESQILGQVKVALEWADDAGTCGSHLRRLWERALRIGKRVRAETTIGDGALSHAYAALELARKIFGGLDDRRVLIIGAGEIATLALENLQGIATAGVTVMNRTRERAETMAEWARASIRPFDELEAALVDADLVITSTGAKEPVLPLDLVRRVRATRGGRRPLLLVDLGLPRDVDPRAAGIDGVYLKNLDDLAAVVAANTRQRVDELPRAEAIVAAGTAAFLDWAAALAVEPAVRELRDAFERARGEELAAVQGRLDPDTYAILDETTRRLIARLLHLPSANLRRDDALRDPEVLALFRRLFLEELPHPSADPREPRGERDQHGGDQGGGDLDERVQDGGAR